MSVFSKQDYDLINLGVCIKQQAERLDVEHEGVPLEGIVVRIAEAAIAARREAIRLLTAESRLGVAAEEPEWEYGIRAQGDDEPYTDHSDDPDWLCDQVTPEPGDAIVRRRKAGPWVPVKQEGVGDDDRDA